MKNFFKLIIVKILEIEARLCLRKYKPKIVAITGSVGKTSAKEAVGTVLSSVYSIRKSQKSFNSEIGLPLTILGLENAWTNPILWLKNIVEGFALIVFPNKYPEWLVLEVGADKPRDIESVAYWLAPDITIFTRMGKVPVHVENFKSPEHLIKEKSHLILATKKDGTVIAYGDDEVVLDIARKSQANVLVYGFGEGSNLRASNEHIIYGEENGPEEGMPGGMSFKLDYGGHIIPVRLPGVFGKQSIYAALAGVAAGIASEMNILDATEAVSFFQTLHGRMKLVEGIKHSHIIDDTYNASPIAVEEALSALEMIKIKGRKIVVLGDMMELGKYTIEAHRAVGVHSAKVGDILVAVGQRAKFIAEGAELVGMKKRNTQLFNDSREAGQWLDKKIKTGDVILVKGSQYMRMERTVEEIMANPEQKETLLARQEKEWQNR